MVRKAGIRGQGSGVRIINLPLKKADALSLKVGDVLLINGLIVTGRDKLHKFLFDGKVSKKDIPFNLNDSILYHCGPIVKRDNIGYKIIAAGPTTSMRVEMYEHKIISKYGIRGIMGKGGMEERTLQAMKEKGCVYLHTIGGAAVYLAERIKKVSDVWRLEEFGATEAMWLLQVENFPAIVTMDAHGRSLHKDIEKKSYNKLRKLIGK